MGGEEGHVEAAGAAGDLGDEAEAGRQVRLGVEAGHEAAPAAALRAAPRQARSHQHLQQYRCN